MRERAIFCHRRSNTFRYNGPLCDGTLEKAHHYCATDEAIFARKESFR